MTLSYAHLLPPTLNLVLYIVCILLGIRVWTVVKQAVEEQYQTTLEFPKGWTAGFTLATVSSGILKSTVLALKDVVAICRLRLAWNQMMIELSGFAENIFRRRLGSSSNTGITLQGVGCPEWSFS